jgi:transposase-like protein
VTERISADVEQRIVALWKTEQWPTGSIAREVGVSPTTVLRTVKRNGLPVDKDEIRGRLRRTTPDEDAEIVRRYLAGEGAQTIADDYGLKFHVSVLQRVRAAGHQSRPPGPRFKEVTPDLAARMVALREQESLTYEAISAAVGLSPRIVGRWLRVNGYGPLGPQKRKGRVRSSSGYFAVSLLVDDPLYCMADSNGYAKEHRYVMAQAIGRPLRKDETVHHINGDRGDNRLENLQLRQGRHGKGARFVCMDCGSHNVEAATI